MIIREHCEQLYISKLDNLDEMDKLLEMHKLTNLIQEQTENQQTYIRRLNQEENTKKKSGSDVFISKFKQTFSADLIPIFLKCF